MRPIPTAFHLGPLVLHTYGIGLAIAFYVAYRYLVHRVAKAGIATDWLVGLGVVIAVAAVVGARLLNVLTNLGYYRGHPAEILAVWHGGLASFGGLLLAVPAALWYARRRHPEVSVLRGLDLAVPAMALGWSVGRLLGPQLMVRGGGHPTTQWFGMYYAGQAGRRIPVPIIQALEDGALFVVLLLLERHLTAAASRRGLASPLPAPGALTALAMVVWGVVRALDERLWLGEEGHLGSVLVQLGGLALAIGGLVLAAVTWRRWHEQQPTPGAAPLEDRARVGGP